MRRTATAERLPRAAPGGAASTRAGDVVLIGSHPIAKFYLRCHVALLILWSFAVGALMTKALLLVGVASLPLRYALALAVAYGAFFVGVRLWLAYIGIEPFGRGASVGGGNGSGGASLPDFTSGGGGGSASKISDVVKGGGDFGGGGASSSFADGVDAPDSSTAPAVPRLPLSFASRSAGASSGSGGGFDLDLGDDGWLIVLLLVLAAALLCSVFGAVLYLVWTGPSLLADVAFQAMLAAGLVKSAAKWRDACWETRLLRATWIPFVIVTALAIAMAVVAQHVFPDARTLADVVHALRGRLG